LLPAALEPQRRKIIHPIRLGSLRHISTSAIVAHIKGGGSGVGILVAETLTSIPKIWRNIDVDPEDMAL